MKVNKKYFKRACWEFFLLGKCGPLSIFIRKHIGNWELKARPKLKQNLGNFHACFTSLFDRGHKRRVIFPFKLCIHSQLTPWHFTIKNCFLQKEAFLVLSFIPFNRSTASMKRFEKFTISCSCFLWFEFQAITTKFRRWRMRAPF